MLICMEPIFGNPGAVAARFRASNARALSGLALRLCRPWNINISVSALALLFTLLVAPEAARPVAQPATLPDLLSADALGADLFAHTGSTGMVLVVVRNNQVFFRGYGETAPNSRQAPTADSVVRLCSLTKIFTTDLLTKLASDRTVALDDPLQRYAPPHLLVANRIKPITLIDLATHTAGLPRELGRAPAGTPHFTFPDYNTRWRWLPHQHLRSTPGSVALYSNVGYDLLGDALESAAHKPFASVLAERTLRPLRMYQTTYYPSAAQCARLLISARDEGSCTSTAASAGSSGLYSTPADMAIWLKYLLGTDVPYVPAQDAAAQAVYISPASLVSQAGLEHAGSPTGIGLGWVHLLPLADPSHIIEKTGGGAGFTTYIAINQSRHTAVFVAATQGVGETRVNLFKGANDILLALAGLPPIAPEPAKIRMKQVHRRRVRPARAHGA
jgi:D-alanyl-D-alanine-carboxypeptidase/D-alanyl-D-alanine-endopeptidase